MLALTSSRSSQREEFIRVHVPMRIIQCNFQRHEKSHNIDATEIVPLEASTEVSSAAPSPEHRSGETCRAWNDEKSGRSCARCVHNQSQADPSCLDPCDSRTRHTVCSIAALEHTVQRAHEDFCANGVVIVVNCPPVGHACHVIIRGSYRICLRTINGGQFLASQPTCSRSIWKLSRVRVSGMQGRIADHDLNFLH
jgi:hypothetical protein